MQKTFIALLLFITQTSFVKASDMVLFGNDALILSPSVFVLAENTQAEEVAILSSDLSDGIIATLSWTDNNVDRRAKIEIVNITNSEEKSSVVIVTKQWLPYTLSGEVLSLPVLLTNAKLKFH